MLSIRQVVQALSCTVNTPAHTHTHTQIPTVTTTISEASQQPAAGSTNYTWPSNFNFQLTSSLIKFAYFNNNYKNNKENANDREQQKGEKN